MNDNININSELLCFLNMTLENGRGKFSELLLYIDNLVVNGSDLTTIGNLDDVKKIVYDVCDSYDKICFRMSDIINLLMLIDPTIGFDENGESILDFKYDNNVFSYSKTLSDGTKYSTYVVGNVDSTTPVIVLNHGAAGAGDYNILNNYLNGENDINAIIVTCDRNSTSRAIDTTMIVKDVVNNFSLPFTNVITAGFSAGGERSIKQMADLVKINNNFKPPMTVMIDGYINSNGGQQFVFDEDLELLGEQNAVIFPIIRDSIDCDYKHYERWVTEYGINVIKVVDNVTKTHYGVFDNYFNNGLMDFYAGNGGFPSGDYYTPQVYQTYIDDDGNTCGEWVDVNIEGKTLDEVYKILGITIPPGSYVNYNL